jgi:hypothetical protein
VAQQLLGPASERHWIRRHWIRYARTHLTGMFPHLPGQSGYGKRLRAAGPLIASVITELARDVDSWHDLLWLVDFTPLPCAASRETVRRSDLAGHAGYGFCASHFRYFWGFRLYLVCTADGMPIIWGLASPKIGEREVVAALLEHEHHGSRTSSTGVVCRRMPSPNISARRSSRQNQPWHGTASSRFNRPQVAGPLNGSSG